MNRSITSPDDAEMRRLNARARRARLRTLGIEPGIVAGTPDDGLLALFPVQLRLVPDIEEADFDPRDIAPRVLPFGRVYDESPDEAESTRIGAARLRGEYAEMSQYVYAGPSPYGGGVA